MNKVLISFLCFLQTISNCYAVEPISGKDLFQNPETFSMKISPSGSYIISYNQGEDGNFFELIDPKTEKSHLLMNIPFHKKFNLKKYEWVDNNTVYIALNEKIGFLHIDFSGKTPKGKYISSKAKGYLVSGLPEKEDTVLFVRKVGRFKKKHKLVHATTKQLEQNKVNESIDLGIELNGAVQYTYSDVNHTIMAYTIEGDDVVYWFRKFNSSGWEEFWRVDKKVSFTPVGFLTENTLAVLTNQDENLVSLREFNIQTQKLGKILFQHAMYDLIEAELEPLGKGIKSVSYIQNGVPAKHYFSNEMQQEDTNLKNAFNQQQFAIVDTNLDDSLKIILVLNSNNPGEYYLYDTKAKKVQYLKEKSLHLNKEELTQSKVFTVNVENSVDVEAILSMPISNSNGVLIVNPHGGPIGVRDYATYDPKIQYFTSRGYTILNVNYRGSSGFGKEFLKQGKAQFGQLIEQDISKVVREIKKRHTFNYTCSMGSSYGGYSAVMLAIQNPDSYQCVIAMYGVYDLPLLFNASNFERLDKNRIKIEEIVGELDKSLREVSPFYIADKIEAPVLLIAGGDDEIAYIEHTNRMKYRLKQLSKDVETLMYDNVGHGHHRWDGDMHQFAFIDDFITRKLKLSQKTSDKSLPALANDAVVIADAYNFNSWFKPNFEKALYFYRKAADFGHKRAMFNIGSFYHQGKVVDMDIEKAIAWYKQSSEGGYADASYRLGELYLNGSGVDKDELNAYEKFLLASQQKKNYFDAELALTRAICLGEGVVSNVEKCLNRLFFIEDTIKLKKLSTAKFNSWRDILTQVLWRNKFNHQTKKRLYELVKSELDVDLFDVFVEEETYGLYEGRFHYSTYKTHSEKTNIVPIVKNTTFGVTLFFDTNRIKEGKSNKQAMIKFRWILPDKISKHNEIHSRIIDVKSKGRIRFTLSEKYELIKGEWRLEVYSIYDKLLYSKTFVTQKKS